MGTDEWRWYGWYSDFKRPMKWMVRENLDWARFLVSAPYHPFSMVRFCIALFKGLRTNRGDLLSIPSTLQTFSQARYPDKCMCWERTTF
jgi:hypothetical protein